MCVCVCECVCVCVHPGPLDKTDGPCLAWGLLSVAIEKIVGKPFFSVVTTTFLVNLGPGFDFMTKNGKLLLFYLFFFRNSIFYIA